jgi:hypothetical protein
MVKVVLVAMLIGGLLGAGDEKLADNHDKATPDIVPPDSVEIAAPPPDRIIFDY